jgi:hypothetical protein
MTGKLIKKKKTSKEAEEFSLAPPDRFLASTKYKHSFIWVAKSR